MEPPPAAPPEHPAAPGLATVARAAASRWLLQAVGREHVTALQHRLAQASGSLSCPPSVFPAAPPAEWRALRRQALYGLARECIALPSAVESGFDDGTAGLAGAAGGEDAGDCGWDFGVAVAEATAGSLAAFVAGLEPEAGDGALELLERLSLDLDYFAAHLFGGLRRLGSQPQCLGSGEERLLLALQAVCAWTLAAMGRCIGYTTLTPSILWEWACNDPLWACVLAKGVISIPPDAGSYGCIAAMPIPTDLVELQRAVLDAMLGLAQPSVAFAETGFVAEDEEEAVAIAGRNTELVRHRSELASAAASCQLTQALLAAACSDPTAMGPRLAAFLVALLQPELAKYGPAAQSPALEKAAADVLVGAPSPAAVEAVAEARQASDMLAGQLSRQNAALWTLLAQALQGVVSGHPAVALVPSLLRDCADLAYLLPPSDEYLQAFLNAGLVGAPGALDSEPAALAALCAVAANACATPGAGGPLVSALARLPADARAAAFARWERWRGPIRPAGLGQWALLLQLQAQAEAAAAAVAQAAALALQAPPPTPAPAAFASPAPPLPQRGRGTVLQDLVATAPAEFRCAYDGQLMMDPVRSPQGHVFERAGLAHILAVLGGLCPVTGSPLTVDDCVRVPELRQRITRWVREQHATRARQPRRPQVAAAGSASSGASLGT